MRERNDFFEISPFQVDGGELIGRDPVNLPSEILALKYRAKNPLKAIRERCLDCCCGRGAEVRKCVAVECPSWPFRMGTNPFRKKRVLSATQRSDATKRLGKAKRSGR